MFTAAISDHWSPWIGQGKWCLVVPPHTYIHTYTILLPFRNTYVNATNQEEIYKKKYCNMDLNTCK